MAEIQAIAGGDDQVGNVGMGVEEGEGFFEQAVGVVREHVAGGDEEGQVEAVAVGAHAPMAGSSSDEGRSDSMVPIAKEGAGQYIGRPRMPFSRPRQAPPPRQLVAGPGIFLGILLPDRSERVAFLQGVPQLALAVLVEGDAEADDFEDVLAGAPLSGLRHWLLSVVLCFELGFGTGLAGHAPAPLGEERQTRGQQREAQPGFPVLTALHSWPGRWLA
jgi:hypothetical protein